MRASTAMHDRAFVAYQKGEMTIDEYNEHRQEIMRKVSASIERKNMQITRVNERDPKFGSVFKDTFFREKAAAALRQGDGSIVMIDVDHFRTVNARLGHDGGDIALRFLANSASATAKNFRGFAGRLGGEEFGVLIPGERRDALRFVAMLVKSMKEEFARNDLLRSLLQGNMFTFSAGVATNQEQSAFTRLMKLADRRLYAAKGAGRNRMVSTDNPQEARVLA